MEFKVGDRIRVVVNCPFGHYRWGEVGRVTKIGKVGIYGNSNAIWINELEKRGGGAWGPSIHFKKLDEVSLIKLEELMSLRNQIKALKNGWDKEADDILQEILENLPLGNNWVHIIVENCGDAPKNAKGWIKVETFSAGNMEPIYFHSQCEKHKAFQDALLWLLDKSGLEGHKVGDEIKIASERKTYRVKILEKL